MTQRQNIMIGTAGHIDHGKTRLVHLMTGCDTDTLPEEKARGLSIDLGFAPCRLQDERIVGIVDVPGHERFIRNMVAGATGIDLLLLVIAADDGIMPQTTEHLDVVLLLGVRHGIVAVTKTDLVSPDRVEEVTGDVRRLLVKTALADAPICPVSSETGEGFGDFYDILNAVAATVPPRPVDGIFRLAAERSFTAEGFGTVVTGIPCSGRVGVGDTLELFDLRQRARRTRVRRLEVYGRDAEEGLSGQCVAVNLADVRVEEVDRTCVVATPGYLAPQEFVELRLRLAHRPDIRPLKSHSEVHFHTGTVSALGRVRFLDDTCALEPGSTCLAQIHLTEPLVAARGDRFVVRGQAGQSGTRVIGGGRVVDTCGRHLKQRPWTVEKLKRWEAALDDPPALLAEAVREAPMGLTTLDAARRALLPGDVAERVAGELKGKGGVSETRGGRLVHEDNIADLLQDLSDHLTSFHRANPQNLGQREEDLRALVAWPNDVFDLVLGAGQSRGLTVEGDWVRLSSHKPDVPDEKTDVLSEIEQRIHDGELRPPQPSELVEALKLSEPEVLDLLRLLTERQTIVKVDKALWFHRDTLAGAAELVRTMFAEGGAFTTMDFRDRLGTSRKYAVPILDYFDTLSLTRRTGNRRLPGRNLDTGAGPIPPRTATT